MFVGSLLFDDDGRSGAEEVQLEVGCFLFILWNRQKRSSQEEGARVMVVLEVVVVVSSPMIFLFIEEENVAEGWVYVCGV